LPVAPIGYAASSGSARLFAGPAAERDRQMVFAVIAVGFSGTTDGEGKRDVETAGVGRDREPGVPFVRLR
jgi:hypothetical protein